MNRITIAVSTVLCAACVLPGMHSTMSSTAAASPPPNGGAPSADTSQPTSSSAFDTDKCGERVPGPGQDASWGNTLQINYSTPNHVIEWDCFDGNFTKGTQAYRNSSKWQTYELLKTGALKATLNLEIVRKSFDEHYKAETTKEKLRERDRASPDDYCLSSSTGPIGDFIQHGPGTGSALAFLVSHPDVRTDFLSKVDTLSCEYSDTQSGSIKLIGKRLVFYVDSAKREHIYSQNIPEKLMEMFPSWKKGRFALSGDGIRDVIASLALAA